MKKFTANLSATGAAAAFAAAILKLSTPNYTFEKRCFSKVLNIWGQIVRNKANKIPQEK